MSTLILTLPLAHTGASTEYRYTLSADGHSATRHARASASLLPPTGRAGELVAVVPARALSWQRVVLPPGVGPQNPRLRSVLEGLLEDRLLDEPAQLHFALQPGARPGSPAWVAICDRAWLRAALQALEAAGRPVARVVPEFAPDSDAPCELHVLGTPEDALLVLTRPGSTQGVVVLPLSAASLSLAALDPQDEPPAVLADPAVATLAEQVLGRAVALRTESDRALRAARGTWDLAQFDLASTGRTRALRKASGLAGSLLAAPQWRAARWGAGLVVLAHLAGINAWAWQEKQTLAAKQAGVRNTLTQTFPHVKVVANAPVQMEREVALLRQSAGSLSSRDFEPLLAAAGSALPPELQPTAIDYSPGELRLRGINLPGEALAAANTAARATGHSVRSDGDTLLVRTIALP